MWWGIKKSQLWLGCTSSSPIGSLLTPSRNQSQRPQSLIISPTSEQGLSPLHNIRQIAWMGEEVRGPQSLIPSLQSEILLSFYESHCVYLLVRMPPSKCAQGHIAKPTQQATFKLTGWVSESRAALNILMPSGLNQGLTPRKGDDPRTSFPPRRLVS